MAQENVTNSLLPEKESFPKEESINNEAFYFGYMRGVEITYQKIIAIKDLEIEKLKRDNKIQSKAIDGLEEMIARLRKEVGFDSEDDAEPE